MRKGFISYSHADRAICDALFKQLAPIGRTACRFWRDPDLKAGADWNKTIGWHLNRCHIALILLSADALKSDGFIVDIELPKLKRRAGRGECLLVLVSARKADFAEFDDLADCQTIPRAKAGGFFILGPDATGTQTDEWCVAVVEEIRALLATLPPLDEHDPSVGRALKAAKAALRAFEDSAAFAAMEEDVSNDIEKQISGVKGALRAPRADFWFSVNAMAASWQQKVVARIALGDPARNLAQGVTRAMAELDRAAEAAGYDWPPDRQRAENRGLLAAGDAGDAVTALHSQLDRIKQEALYTAQPGREPAKTIADGVADKAAIARALSQGDAIDGEGASEALSEADRIVAAGEVELEAAGDLEGGRQDLYNLARLREATEPGQAAGRNLARLTPPAPNDATRKKWELEAAVAILTGQPIPPARQPHLRRLSLAPHDDDLFEALKSRSAALGEIYTDPEANQYQRRIALSDLTPLEGLSSLQRLHLNSTPVSDWSPVDHINIVYGRPDDWPRKTRGK